MSDKPNGVLISELNAQALAANLSDIRATYDHRLQVLENEVATLKVLLTNMQRVYGELLQVKMGHGSTERG